MKHGEVRFLSCMYVLSLTLLAAFAIRGLAEAVTVSAGAEPAALVILDAGHGGPDGGSVSQHGTEESEINLSVTLRTDAILGFLGEQTILTRDSDADLSSEDAKTISQKKISDIRNRTAMVNAHPEALLVSIHQNTYPDPACHGAKVFYNRIGRSQALAELLSENLYSELDPSSNRAVKPIAPDIYLMNHVDVPGVLVECGFLTNAEEESRLTSAEYQMKLAVILAGSIVNYLCDDDIDV